MKVKNVKFIYDTKDVVVFFDGSYKKREDLNLPFLFINLIFEITIPLKMTL